MSAWWARLSWDQVLAIYFLGLCAFVIGCSWLERLIWYYIGKHDPCPRCHGTGRRRP